MMKTSLGVLAIVAAVLAAAYFGFMWNEARISAADTAKVLEQLRLDAQSGDGEAAGEKSPEGLARDVLRTIDALRTDLDILRGEKVALEEEAAALKGRLASAEERIDVVAKANRSQADAAAAAAREETAEQIVAARAETQAAVKERIALQNELAALQTRFDDLQASYEALMAASGDSVDVSESAGGTGALAEEDPLGDIPATPETPETAEEPEEGLDVGGEVVGLSKYFVTISYDLPSETMEFQLQNGEAIVYYEITPETADKVSQSGDALDRTYDFAIKGKFRCDRKEKAVWSSYRRWAEGNADEIEALWRVTE